MIKEKPLINEVEEILWLANVPKITRDKVSKVQAERVKKLKEEIDNDIALGNVFDGFIHHIFKKIDKIFGDLGEGYEGEEIMYEPARKLINSLSGDFSQDDYSPQDNSGSIPEVTRNGKLSSVEETTEDTSNSKKGCGDKFYEIIKDKKGKIKELREFKMPKCEEKGK